jgi:aldehyde dehydrogenase
MESTKKSFDIPKFKEQYENYINGEWTAPKGGEYFDCISPVDGRSFTKVARSNEADVNAALDAAHEAFKTWGKTSATERSNILLKIADRMEQNLELLARAETWDNGKPIRETTFADIPRSGLRKGVLPNWTATLFRSLSANRSVWSDRSSRGIFRS